MSVAAQTEKKVEQERLVDLFQDLVVKQQKPWTERRRLVDDSYTTTVYKTRQSLEYGLSKQLRKLSVQDAVNKATALTQWS